MSFFRNLFARCGCGSKKKSEPEPVAIPQDEEVEVEVEVRTEGRAQWASPTEFLLTCIGYSVGLGNVWRFPYLCYKSGGGAFLLPYCLMILFIGMPLLYMEYAFGQYFGVGSLSIFKKVCPMFQGIGIGYVVLNALVCIYYNVIIALSLYYLFASFTANLPWASCDNEWNTDLCGDLLPGNASMYNETGNGTYASFNDTLNSTIAALANRTSSTEEYFQHKLLAREDYHDVSNLGEIRWQLCLCLLLAWILVVLFVSRGIQSTGKVAYFTATFPYVMLTVLVVRGVTLDGASEGILYFITPQWSALLKPEIWYAAATQLFYSTNLAWGGMITMASYNTFNHNCFRDAIMINIVSFLTSLYAGFAVFSIIGAMAKESGLEIEHVIKSGPELAFVVYPRALSLMPLAPMWSALFFFMLFLLGIGSQMVILETVVTGFVDEFPRLGLSPLIRFFTTILIASLFFSCGIASTTQMVGLETVMSGLLDEFPVLRRWRLPILFTVTSIFFMAGLSLTTQMVDVETVMTGILDESDRLKNHRMPVLLAVCGAFFLFGIPLTTQGGMHVLQLMDHYAAGFCVLVIAVVECVVINWIYKNEKFSANVKEMLNRKPAIWWRICWKYISPILLLAVLVYSLVDFTRAKYGAYQYPLWADAIGLCMTLASVLPIFIVAGYKLARAPGRNIKEKWFAVTTPIIDSKDECVKSLDGSSMKCKTLNELKVNDIEEHLDTEDETKTQTHSLMDNHNVDTKC